MDLPPQALLRRPIQGIPRASHRGEDRREEGAEVQRGQAARGQERDRAADGHEQGGQSGRHDSLRSRTPDGDQCKKIKSSRIIFLTFYYYELFKKATAKVIF